MKETIQELNEHSHIEPERKQSEYQTRAREGTSCPSGGAVGADYNMYQLCPTCKNQEECKRLHDREARRLKESRGPLPLRLEIPIGLMVADLDGTERAILALVYYRHKGKNNRISWDKNITFAQAAGTTDSTISRRLDNGPRSLITRGYLTSKIERRRRGKRQPKKGEPVEYRTSRELRLTIKTLRLINRYRETKDGL